MISAKALLLEEPLDADADEDVLEPRPPAVSPPAPEPEPAPELLVPLLAAAEAPLLPAEIESPADTLASDAIVPLVGA
jgi:hypothetical protein